MTTILPSVKEERHDEAEIRELARKMVEAHKLQAAKQTQQVSNQSQSSFLGSTLTQQNSILNYLQRKPVVTSSSSQMAQQTGANNSTNSTTTTMNGSSNHHNHHTIVDEAKPADDESLKGHFGWESFNSGKIHIPYIIRQTEKYCAVRIVEQKLLNKYLNVLHQDLYNCTSIRSYYITDVEARLLDEINFRHCDQYFGKEKFSMKDLIVRLSDAQKFQQFLDVCYKKLTNYSTPNDKCGFIRINSESVVPYTVRDGQKMVPLFYFEGETENLKLKADSLSGWDLSYLKFCCKVQGIRNELFASDTVPVISLDDIKGYFPQGTVFEDYWPNKVVDTQLLMPQKSHNSTVNWTHPPPKQMINPTQQRSQQQLQVQKQQQQQQVQAQQQQQQQQQQQSQQQQRSMNSLQHMYQQNMDMSYLRSMQAGMTPNQQALSNGWSNQLTQSQLDQMFRLTSSAQTKQASSTRTYSRQQQQQMQSLLQSGMYPYSGSGMSLNSNGHSRSSSTQQPPPLVRSAQQQNQMSNGSTAQLQLRSTNNPSSANTQSNTSSSSTSYPYPASNSSLSSNKYENSNNNVVTITRCPSNTTSNNNNHSTSSNSSSQNPASYLNRIPASTTITPTQYLNNNNNNTSVGNSSSNNNNNSNSKDHSLPSSLSIYPKNSQNGNARNIIQSNVSPVIASPTRASPAAGFAKQPSISPASQIQNLPVVLQQQLNELFLKQNFSDPEVLKETFMQYTNLYSNMKTQQQNPNIAGSQSSHLDQVQQQLQNLSYPLRNKSVITTSRSSPLDVIDLSSNSPTPRSMSVAALQLQQVQQAAAASAANKRAHNGTYMNGNSSSTRSMQSSASSRLQQMQMQSSLAGMNGYGSSPYKIEKSFIDNQMVHCINMIPYSPNSDMIIPLSELRDQFYPSANLDICKRVMQALDINLYSGTKPQYQAYTELGKIIADNVPFVRVCDVITYLPQINYMIRGQMAEAKNASKRARIS
ncbi:myb-like protein P isoform X2 [Chironomus tepperi]|uniref:myb-like protein P isoform X2 n=1 Tax=Chironomus tepperi TaxID=113505 RepID=UPI00391F9B9A